MDIKTSQDKKFDALGLHSARLKETVLKFFDGVGAEHTIELLNELLSHYIRCEDVLLSKEQLQDTVSIIGDINCFMASLSETNYKLQLIEKSRQND